MANTKKISVLLTSLAVSSAAFAQSNSVVLTEQGMRAQGGQSVYQLRQPVAAPPPIAQQAEAPAVVEISKLTAAQFRCEQVSGQEISYYNLDKYQTDRTKTIYINMFRDKNNREVGYNILAGSSLESDLLSMYSNVVHRYMYVEKYNKIKSYNDYLTNQYNNQMQKYLAEKAKRAQEEQDIKEGKIVVNKDNKTSAAPIAVPAELVAPVQPQLYAYPQESAYSSSRYVDTTDKWGKPLTGLEIKVGNRIIAEMRCVPATHKTTNGGVASGDGAAYQAGKRVSGAKVTEVTDYKACTNKDVEGKITIDDSVNGPIDYQVRCALVGMGQVEMDTFVHKKLSHILEN